MLLDEVREFVQKYEDTNYDAISRIFFISRSDKDFMQIFRNIKNSKEDTHVYPLADEYCDKLEMLLDESGILEGTSNSNGIDLKTFLLEGNRARKELRLQMLDGSENFMENFIKDQKFILGPISDTEPAYDGIRFTKLEFSPIAQPTANEFYHKRGADKSCVQGLNKFLEFLSYKHPDELEILKFLVSCLDVTENIIGKYKEGSEFDTISESEYDNILMMQKAAEFDSFKDRIRKLLVNN